MTARLLWITENHPPSRGGMAQSSDRIVRGLRRAGLAVDVVHLCRAPRRAQVERVEGGHDLVVPLEDDPEHALRRAWIDLERLATDPRRAPPTHVVAFGGTLPLLAAPVYAAWLGLPLVSLLRGNDFDTGLFSVRRQGLVHRALQASQVVVTVASRNVALIRALAPHAEVRWITNGIDLDAWSVLPSERERAAAWRTAHVRDGRLVFGLVGQLKRKKGAAFLLEALASSEVAERAHVLLVGEVEDAVATWLGDHEAPFTWTHLPFLDRFELLGWYPVCDFVALPSFYDGLPNVALEAAALGIPLVASDAGGLADLVQDGQNGFRFAAGDRAACRTALGRAVRAPADERVRLGAASRAMIEKSFTAAAETAAYLALFTSDTT